jgi:hypothetical protein
MENTISKMEAMADVIAHFPHFHDSAAMYGHSLFALVDAQQILMVCSNLNEFDADRVCMLLAANGISQAMNKHDMFKINLDGDKVQYEGFDCWNNSCGMFTESEALACAIIMVHGNLGMMTLSLTDAKVISNFKYSETKIAKLLD